MNPGRGIGGLIGCRLALCLCKACVLCGGMALADASPEAILDVEARPNPRLGLAFPGSRPEHYSKLAEAGLGVIRIEASWGHVEPRPGRFDFRGLDNRVRGLQDSGLTPFITFASDARWATVSSTQHLKNATPTDLSQWANFVRKVVERYDFDGQDDMPGLRAAVPYWQAANEFMGPKNPNGGWAGSDAALLEYVNAAHDAVKAADGRAQFVLGGLSVFSIDAALLASGEDLVLVRDAGGGKPQRITLADFAAQGWHELFESRLKRVLGKARFDFADVHLYGPEERDAARIRLARKLSGRPVLSSECGGPSLLYGERYTGHRHYRAVMERNLNVLSEKAPFCLWFGISEEVKATWGNSRVPLYDRNRRPKPGVAAYRLLSRLVPQDGDVLRVDGQRLFEIGKAGQPIAHVALDGTARETLRQALQEDPTVICVNDAQERDVVSLTLSKAARLCDENAVILAGGAVFDLLTEQ